MADHDEQRTHAEGIDHIKSNTQGLDNQNTSSEAAENSGVSNSSQGGVVETVKSYLGMGSGTGTTAAETGQLGTTGDTKNAEDTTSGSGSGSGVTGAAASAASAVGIGSGNQAAGGGTGSTSSSSAPSGTAGQTLETAKEKVQEVANAATKDVTSGTDEHKPPQPADGKPTKLENETSIPTAGGERLGEKHWGESKIVPDRPEPRPSEAGISSEEGQPTQQTTDNTAKNTGGATGPPTGGSGDNSGSGSGSGGSGDNGEDKTKMTDKIKDKLHMHKKD